MSTPQTLPASTGTALLLRKDQTIKITNTHGRQVVDFWALNPSNTAEYLSMSHNHAIHRKIHFATGDTLYSSISRPILSWTEDTSLGDHDTLIAACNALRYERMGVRGWHATCAGNYQGAVQNFCAAAAASTSTSPSSSSGIIINGSRQEETKDGFPFTPPTPLNLFMNVKVEGEGGGIVFRAPTSREGDRVGFRALMDVVVVISACPMDQRASEDWLPDPKEVHYEVMEG